MSLLSVMEKMLHLFVFAKLNGELKLLISHVEMINKSVL